MKLSEAMRKGATLHPQATSDYGIAGKDRWDGIAATCALGAVYEAVTGKFPPRLVEADDEVRDIIYTGCAIDIEDLCEPPEELSGLFTGEYEDERPTLNNVISHLNDKESWSREDIAAWLEQQGL